MNPGEYEGSSRSILARGLLALLICGFGLACKVGREFSEPPPDGGDSGANSTDAQRDVPADSAGDRDAGGAGQGGMAASGGAPGGSGGNAALGGASGTGGAANAIGIGMPCGSGNNCASPLFCVDGVCCQSACNGACEACGEMDTKGMCVPVTGTPRAGHPACAGTGTGCAASCDGVSRMICGHTSTCTVGATECASSSSLGTCVAGPNSCNVQSTTACGGGLVCERLAPANCADPRWAEWPVPPSTSPAGYTDNGDGTVSDRTTGLMWQKTVTSPVMTQPAAVTYCATTARTGGYSDWRLPSKIELLSIVDYGALSFSINPIFTWNGSSWFWSSTPIAGAASGAWFVDFGHGGAETVPLTENNVRCVR